MKQPDIRPSVILSSPEYLEQLVEASRLSYEHKKETGFLTFTDETFSSVRINKPHVYSEWHVDHLSIDENIGGYGYKTVPYSPTLISTHFHPYGKNVVPSVPDLIYLHNERHQNRSMGDIVHAEQYLNPIELIGLYINSTKMRLFIVQVRKDYSSENLESASEFFNRDGLSLEQLEKFAESERGSKVFGGKISHRAILQARFILLNSYLPRSYPKFIDFLERSGMYVADSIIVENSRIKNKEIKRLTKFDEHFFELASEEDYIEKG